MSCCESGLEAAGAAEYLLLLLERLTAAVPLFSVGLPCEYTHTLEHRSDISLPLAFFFFDEVNQLWP